MFCSRPARRRRTVSCQLRYNKGAVSEQCKRRAEPPDGHVLTACLMRDLITEPLTVPIIQVGQRLAGQHRMHRHARQRAPAGELDDALARLRRIVHDELNRDARLQLDSVVADRHPLHPPIIVMRRAVPVRPLRGGSPCPSGDVADAAPGTCLPLPLPGRQLHSTVGHVRRKRARRRRRRDPPGGPYARARARAKRQWRAIRR